MLFRGLVSDMVVYHKLFQSPNLIINMNYVFVNNNKHPQLTKRSFHASLCISNTLIDMHKHFS